MLENMCEEQPSRLLGREITLQLLKVSKPLLKASLEHLKS